VLCGPYGLRLPLPTPVFHPKHSVEGSKFCRRPPMREDAGIGWHPPLRDSSRENPISSSRSHRRRCYIHQRSDMRCPCPIRAKVGKANASADHWHYEERVRGVGLLRSLLASDRHRRIRSPIVRCNSMLHVVSVANVLRFTHFAGRRGFTKVLDIDASPALMGNSSLGPLPCLSGYLRHRR